MKKIICFLVCTLMLLALGTPVVANIQNTDSNIQSAGISVSSSDFGSIFSGNPKARTVQPDNCITQSQISVEGVSILGDSINFIIALQNGDQSITLPMVGTLASSFKEENGINSVIVEVDSEVNGYKVLLFEIFNDREADILLLESVNFGETLQGIPHMKLYLMDDSNQLYLFETALPDCFSNLNASDYARANSEKDALLWATDLVVHNTAIIESEDEEATAPQMSTRGLNSVTTQDYGNWFYDSYYIASEFVESYSKPYVEIYHTNVISGGGSPWFVRFKIEEYTLTQGYTVYGQGAYQYVNVKIGFSTGDNTIINQYMHQGRMIKKNNSNIISAGQSFVAGIIQNSIASLPYGSTFQLALQTLVALTPSDKTVTFGSQSNILATGNCTAYGVDLSKYIFKEDTNHSPNRSATGSQGHYYILQIYPILQRSNSNTQTAGAMYVDFDVEIANELVSIVIPFASELSYQTP